MNVFFAIVSRVGLPSATTVRVKLSETVSSSDVAVVPSSSVAFQVSVCVSTVVGRPVMRLFVAS